jgi:hypothetical protein
MRYGTWNTQGATAPSGGRFPAELKRKYNRSNAETVLDVREIQGTPG